MNGSTINLEDIVKTLNESPIFHMSLGSKELFHSNFLAWITETYPEQMSKLFAELLAPNETSFGKLKCVEREKRNIDLAITFEGVRLIIENKVKSVPYPEQLNDYKAREDAERESDKNLYILLTINEPTFAVEGWSVVTYEVLADKLGELKLTEQYHKSLLNDYIQYIKHLSSIMAIFRFKEPTGDQLFLLKKHDADTLKKLRIYDMVVKYRAAQVEQMLREKFDKKGIAIAYGAKFKDRSQRKPLGLSHGFSRQSAFVAFYCIHSEKPKISTGMLIQDNRLCWAVEMGNEKACKAKYNEVNKDVWLEFANNVGNYQKIKLRKGEEYRKFGGFLYDYVQIPKDALLKDIIDIIYSGINNAIDMSKVIKKLP